MNRRAKLKQQRKTRVFWLCHRWPRDNTRVYADFAKIFDLMAPHVDAVLQRAVADGRICHVGIDLAHDKDVTLYWPTP